jgi:cellulase/cellobiase CelA1
VLRGDSPHDPAFRDAEAAATKAGLGLWGDPCHGQAKPPTSTTPPPQPPPVVKAPSPGTTTKTTTTTTTVPVPVVFGCTVNYRITHSWNGGYNADVTITNTGNAPVSGWTLHWTFTRGQVVTDMWNATPKQSGAEVNATNVSYNVTIQPGATQVVGYTGSNRADNPTPTGFSLNGHPCPIR